MAGNFSRQPLYVLNEGKVGFRDSFLVGKIDVGQKICASTLGDKVIESFRAGLELIYYLFA